MGDAVLHRVARSLLTAALGLACAGLAGATAMTLAARLHWTLELSAHFVLQYAIGAAVLSLFALALRRWKIGALAAAILALHGTQLAGAWLDAPSQGASAGPPLRILIANVNGANRKVHRLRQMIEAEEPDLVLLMEVRQSWSKGMEPLHGRFPHRILETREDNFGIAAYCALPLVAGEVVFAGDAGLPSIQLTVERDGRRLHVLLTHPMPPVSARLAAARDAQLLDVADRVRSLTGDVIVAGDFNATPWSPIFKDLVQRSGLMDSSRGFGLQTTWISRLPAPLRIPIDHALVSRELTVVERSVGPHIGSDHRPILLMIR